MQIFALSLYTLFYHMHTRIIYHLDTLHTRYRSLRPHTTYTTFENKVSWLRAEKLMGMSLKCRCVRACVLLTVHRVLVLLLYWCFTPVTDGHVTKRTSALEAVVKSTMNRVWHTLRGWKKSFFPLVCAILWTFNGLKLLFFFWCTGCLCSSKITTEGHAVRWLVN